MGARGNALPVIVKRKKVVRGGGHHGGAWKVAYADFVTAMMAFFMLMWLLNATTEKQRKGIADYFSPTIPLSRVSGGGDGSFGGESVFSEDQVAQTGTGASARKPSAERQAVGQSGTTPAAEAVDTGRFEAEARAVEEALKGAGGESMLSREALRHVVTKLTDEGLIIEFSDLPDQPLFGEGSAIPEPVTEEIVRAIARVMTLSTNPVAVNGHTSARPEVLREDPSWDLSTARAMQVRRMLEGEGLGTGRAERVAGFADRRPAHANPAAIRNNRIEVILLRRQ
ncbi:MAG: OmpA family protein [Rhodobacteraceae bacterium]|nr:OmpA family protein [Paracoccaceae bacterium]